jgi:hypothetical protein
VFERVNYEQQFAVLERSSKLNLGWELTAERQFKRPGDREWNETVIARSNEKDPYRAIAITTSQQPCHVKGKACFTHAARSGNRNQAGSFVNEQVLDRAALGVTPDQWRFSQLQKGTLT